MNARPTKDREIITLDLLLLTGRDGASGWLIHNAMQFTRWTALAARGRIGKSGGPATTAEAWAISSRFSSQP